MPHPVDSSGCARKIIDVHGQAGVEWLARLPKLVDEWAARWSLVVLPPFAELSYNYVAPVIGPHGAALVLKAGMPHPELWGEIDALRLFDGRGVARLIDADPAGGALLLERVVPGDALKSVTDDEECVRVAAAVMRALWRPLPADHPFRTMAHLAGGWERLRATFDGGYGPFPAARIDRAAALWRELTAESAPPMLIHGDLNPGNILHSWWGGWLAIDPKGYAGDPLFDAATFLNDPPAGVSGEELRRGQQRRVVWLAEALGAPRDAVLAWAEAHAVLSGWWSYEDHGRGWEPALALAEMYEAMRRPL